MNVVFPFEAVYGQERAKKALLLNIVNPKIGGVLLCGEKGTAKSTLVRGIASLGAGVSVVDLPLNATEDRLIGGLDFERALRHGQKRFEPGLLKRADGQILYVDEVNLLGDNIVKALLDAAATGVVAAEREGVSFRYESRFVLVGSMNPEEGPLRSQFLDRFGLFVEVKGENDVGARAEIVRRRLEFERDPEGFARRWLPECERLGEKVRRARELLPSVFVSDRQILLAAACARESRCAGHRAELVVVEAARAIAALELRQHVADSDVLEAASFALAHRAKAAPGRAEERERADDLSGTAKRPEKERAAKRIFTALPEGGEGEKASPDGVEERAEGVGADAADEAVVLEGGANVVFEPERFFAVLPQKWPGRQVSGARAMGRKGPARAVGGAGRYVGYRLPENGDVRDVAFDATIRAAAARQHGRERGGTAIAIRKEDIRVKVRERRVGNTIIFVVDASGSMAANRRMAAVKGAVISLLQEAYKRRDRVGLIAFRKSSAELLLDITKSVELAKKKLNDLPTGGNTPIASGLGMAFEVIKAAKRKDRDVRPIVVLLTDGKATSAGGDAFGDALREARRLAAERVRAVVIDTEQTFIRQKKAAVLAEAMNAELRRLEEIEAENIAAAVRSFLGEGAQRL